LLVRRAFSSNIRVGVLLTALLFFKLIEVETKSPFANSISAFSRSQDPRQTIIGGKALAV